MTAAELRVSGKVNMKPDKVLFFVFLLSGLLAGCSDRLRYPSIETLYKDYLARQDIKKERFEEALGKYYALLEKEGERGGTHSNIGVILNTIQKPEEALKSLQHALKLAENAQAPELIFQVRYNLGVHFGALKKVPEALEQYQAALDLVPDSKEVKTNIELLIQQQQQDQKKNGKGDKDPNNPQNKGEGENKDDQKPGDDQQNQKDQKDKDDQKEGKDKKDDQKKEGSPKYQPRPFKGDQLSEGDVKKILGELKNQEQKIRANFDKKEKGKSKNNEKNW